MLLGIYGYQDSGKTTLVERLVRALVMKGYSVASVKHTPHRKSMDRSGKDTWRHWRAGSDPVVFSSASETSIMIHRPMAPDEIAEMMMDRFRPDVVIIEGAKDGRFPKVAVGKVRLRSGTVLSNPSLRQLVKYVESEVAVERARAKLPGLDCGKCGSDCDGLARSVAAGDRKIRECRELPDVKIDVRIGGEPLPMGRFASSVVDSAVRGLLESLKGFRPDELVEIRLSPKKPGPRRRRR